MFQTSGARRGLRTAKWWANSCEKQIEFKRHPKALPVRTPMSQDISLQIKIL